MTIFFLRNYIKFNHIIFDLGVKGLTMDLTALSSKITTLSQIFSHQALPLSQ